MGITMLTRKRKTARVRLPKRGDLGQAMFGPKNIKQTKTHPQCRLLRCREGGPFALEWAPPRPLKKRKI